MLEYVDKMLNRFNNDLHGITVGCEEEQIMNSEQCSELNATSAAMVCSNDHVITMMDSSSMMDNTLPKNSIYYYFSSTFEVAKCIAIFSFSCVHLHLINSNKLLPIIM